MGDEHIPSAILILSHFLHRLDELPTNGSTSSCSSECGRSKLLAVTRAIVMHRMRLPPKGVDQGVDQLSLFAKTILEDLSLASRRVEKEGLLAVCDDPAHAGERLESLLKSQ